MLAGLRLVAWLESAWGEGSTRCGRRGGQRSAVSDREHGSVSIQMNGKQPWTWHGLQAVLYEENNHTDQRIRCNKTNRANTTRGGPEQAVKNAANRMVVMGMVVIVSVMQIGYDRSHIQVHSPSSPGPPSLQIRLPSSHSFSQWFSEIFQCEHPKKMCVYVDRRERHLYKDF